MKNSIKEFVKLGKIPNDDDMTNELFKQYDLLLQNEEPLTYTEAELIISMFSDDCDDLNWALLHAIESVDFYDVERYKKLSKELTKDYGKGFDYSLLYKFVRSYKMFLEILNSSSPKSVLLLSWTHYRAFLKVNDKRMVLEYK